MEVLREAAVPTTGIALLDPFAGSGTGPLSLVDFADNSSKAIGIERNPFLQFVARTKIGARIQGASDFERTINRIIATVESGEASPQSVPALSTFANTSYFPPNVLRSLLEIRSAISGVDCSESDRDLACLCLAATIEPASYLRRDGRALRYEPRKVAAEPLSEFRRRAEVVLEDLATAGSTSSSAEVVLGDGRYPSRYIPEGFRPSLVLFSPPYPNNIDYTEVYKMEAWLLGFIQTSEEFRAQRLSTLRSHPSVKFPERYGPSVNGHRQDFEESIGQLLQAIPETAQKRWRIPLIRGYFDDMLQALVECASVCREGASVVYVVGNSLHGSKGKTFLIAADLLLARLAESVGLAVERIVVARRPVRKARELTYLRESVVFLRKPQSTAIQSHPGSRAEVQHAR
jgi:hypothetical protein